MTNATAPDPGADLDPELRALVAVPQTRRPVKVVQHPAFRNARGAAAPMRVVPLRAASLNVGAAPAHGRRDVLLADEAA